MSSLAESESHSHDTQYTATHEHFVFPYGNSVDSLPGNEEQKGNESFLCNTDSELLPVQNKYMQNKYSSNVGDQTNCNRLTVEDKPFTVIQDDTVENALKRAITTTYPLPVDGETIIEGVDENLFSLITSSFSAKLKENVFHSGMIKSNKMHSTISLFLNLLFFKTKGILSTAKLDYSN